MSHKKILFLCVYVLAFQGLINAQNFNEKYVSSLIIKKQDSLTFTGDSLFVDTLQMFDQSKLKLLFNTYIVVKNAYIGDNTYISSRGGDGVSGADGGRDFIANGSGGGDGTPGNDLLLIISFNQLGSLTIITDGGKGGAGGNGFSPFQNKVAGERGFDGGNGGQGGTGKSAGNLSIYYTYRDFIPRFNREGPHSIHLSMKGGICGKSGTAGKGGKGGPMQVIRDPTTNQIIYTIPQGSNGNNGIQKGECYTGTDGKLLLKKINN